MPYPGHQDIILETKVNFLHAYFKGHEINQYGPANQIKAMNKFTEYYLDKYPSIQEMKKELEAPFGYR